MDLYQLIIKDEEFRYFIRLNSYYVRLLYRDHTLMNEIYCIYKEEMHKTMGDKLNRISQMMNYAQMLF